MLNKKLLNEILIIVFMGAAIAVIYNLINPDRLEFLPKDKSELVVPDSLLFDFTVPAEISDISATDTSSIATDDSPKTSEDENISATEIKKSASDTTKDAVAQKTANVQHDNVELTDAAVGSGDFRIVTFEQMRRITQSQGFIIIDARQPEQFAKSHIPKSINLFPYMNESELMPKLLSLSREKTIVIYCDGGNCDLSHEIGTLLKNFGYSRIFLYEGGWDEWSRRAGS